MMDRRTDEGVARCLEGGSTFRSKRQSRLSQMIRFGGDIMRDVHVTNTV
jgi:hypothetical protein